jgi:hypothetical protein
MDEFMPQRTLVITPGKMAAFYSHHKLELEAFPFTGMSALSARPDMDPS